MPHLITHSPCRLWFAPSPSLAVFQAQHSLFLVSILPPALPKTGAWEAYHWSNHPDSASFCCTPSMSLVAPVHYRSTRIHQRPHPISALSRACGQGQRPALFCPSHSVKSPTLVCSSRDSSLHSLCRADCDAHPFTPSLLSHSTSREPPPPSYGCAHE